MRSGMMLLFALLINVFVFSQNQIVFDEIRPPYKSVSPTISKLQKLNSDNFSDELNELQIKIKNEGLPLIEKDPLYDDYLHMTLIYQDSTVDKEISFEVFGVYDEYRLGDMKMHRLENTDLYYRCYMIPDDICFSYRFKITDTLTNESMYDIDTYNENKIPVGIKKSFTYSVLDLRQDEPDWNEKRHENIGSRIDTVVFDSKIMNNTRNIFIYLPPDYNQQKKSKYPVIYLFDSFIYLNRVEVPNVLDNLIKENKIEPMIAVMIDNPTNTSRLTELPYNFEFKQFVVEELVPFIREKYNVSLDPDENIIGGISYGGLASTFIAFYHADIFGKILSQSGSFWRDLEWYDSHGVEVRGDWLINKFLIEENRNLKIFLDWGLQENWCLSSGRRMARILDKKGYEYKFVEFNGWHDWSNSRKTFPVGLLYLLEDK